MSTNVVELIEMLDEELGRLQEKDTFCLSIKNPLRKLPVEQEYKRRQQEIKNIGEGCFVEKNILWKRIVRYFTKNTVIVIPKSIISQLITEVHGNILYQMSKD